MIEDHLRLDLPTITMNPQRGVVIKQSMSGSLLSLRDRLLEERARIELALKNPSAILASQALNDFSSVNGRLDEIIELPPPEPKGMFPLNVGFGRGKRQFFRV